MVFCNLGHSSVIAQGRGKFGLGPHPRMPTSSLCMAGKKEQNVLPASLPQGRVLPHPSQDQLQAWELHSLLGTHVFHDNREAVRQPSQATEK